MNNSLYIIAAVLIICWALGFFVYFVSGIIHVLLGISVLAILLTIIIDRHNKV